MSIFGNIFDANQLEVAVRGNVKLWFNTYLTEVELQREIETPLARPRSYLVSDEFDREPAAQTPSIVVISPGIEGEPIRHGDGMYCAWFNIGVGVFAESRDRESTERLVRQYCAVIRSIMIQNPSQGGVASETVWVDESYDELDFDDSRTFSAGQVLFRVYIEDILNDRAGPAVPIPPDPDTLPGSNWPTVATVTVTTDLKEEG